MASGGCANATCKSCQMCVTCQPVCYEKQTLCELTGQSASTYASHSWPSSFSKDEIVISVLPRSVFNTAFSYINTALARGNTQSTSSWRGSPETRDFIYADKVNEILTGLSKFENGHNISQAKQNDVITSDYFTSIAQSLNSAKISSSACDTCNAACNVTCKECQTCVECQGCVSCQGYTTCHSPCHSPCHTPCHTPSGST